MVATKKTIDWHTVESVATPSQTRAYIDSCKEWLLALPDEEEDEMEISTHEQMPLVVDPCEHHNNGMLRENIFVCNTFRCFMCKASCEVSKGRSVVANPFTRSQCIMLCNECHA